MSANCTVHTAQNHTVNTLCFHSTFTNYRRFLSRFFTFSTFQIL